MLQRQELREFPIRFTPRGLVDARDSTDKFPGACTQLTNLVFDQANPEIMVSRPGVTEITAFAGFSSPGVVSCHITVGDITYGMIATSRNANKDEPFAYNHATGAFVTVSGVTNANTPTTQAASGAWTPPTMASVGVYIFVTHPGFPGSATKFGYFDITSLTAPVWAAGDTTTNGLTGVPRAVANFGNRAYFAYSNRLEYTDVLSLTRSASSQALTIGDASPVTALAGLPIQTTSSGVVQALLAFKDFQTWQITGDAATSTLAQNYLSLTFGCPSPRSIAQSLLGTYFASSFGPMIVDTLGVVRPLTHSVRELEQDVHVPWENATTPSRIVGSCSGKIYRVCMETTINGVTATNDYWFHEDKRRWTGPHSFSYDSASRYGAYFVLASNANTGSLFRSDAFANATSVFTDDGATLTSTIASSTFPKTGALKMNQVVESTIELASAGSVASFQITARDEIDNTLNSAQVSILPTGALWGSGVWGGFAWASSQNKPTTYNVPWTQPLVFKKLGLYITATAQTALNIGTFFARYRECGYANVR